MFTGGRFDGNFTKSARYPLLQTARAVTGTPTLHAREDFAMRWCTPRSFVLGSQDSLHD
jgi:hypothetical protein